MFADTLYSRQVHQAIKGKHRARNRFEVTWAGLSLTPDNSLVRLIHSPLFEALLTTYGLFRRPPRPPQSRSRRTTMSPPSCPFLPEPHFPPSRRQLPLLAHQCALLPPFILSLFSLPFDIFDTTLFASLPLHVFCILAGVPGQ